MFHSSDPSMTAEKTAHAINSFLESPSNDTAQIYLVKAMQALSIIVRETLELNGQEGGDAAYEVTQAQLASFDLNLESKDLPAVYEALELLSTNEMSLATSGRDVVLMQAAAGRAGMLAQLFGYIEKNAPPEPPNKPSKGCKIM